MTAYMTIGRLWRIDCDRADQHIPGCRMTTPLQDTVELAISWGKANGWKINVTSKTHICSGCLAPKEVRPSVARKPKKIQKKPQCVVCGIEKALNRTRVMTPHMVGNRLCYGSRKRPAGWSQPRLTERERRGRVNG